MESRRPAVGQVQHEVRRVLRGGCRRLARLLIAIANRVARWGAVGQQRNESDSAAPEPLSADERWFSEHIGAARQVATFLAQDGISLGGKRVADIGCGDGIIDLGIAHETGPRELIGFDLNLTDLPTLLERARRYHYLDELPSALSFCESTPTQIPAAAGSFDVLVSWSCFEHVGDPLALAKEMRRVIADDGHLMLQLWPFYNSEHGSHLMDWYPNGFVHLLEPEATIRAPMFDAAAADDEHASYMWEEYTKLNQLRLDGLQRALQDGGFAIRRVRLLSHDIQLSDGLARYPLSDLTIAGVMLIAVPV